MGKQKLDKKFKALFDQENYEEALATMNQMLQNTTNQNNAEYYNYKGLCLSRLGKEKEAIESFQKAINLDKKFPEYFCNKASSLIELMMLEEAEKTLDEAIKIESKYSSSYFYKGKALYLKGEYYESLKLFDKSFSLNPKETYAHYWKGLCLREMNCFLDSIKEFKLEIPISPKETKIFSQISINWMKMHKYNEALTHIDKALIHSPYCPELLNNKTICLMKQSKFNQAMIEADKSLLIDLENIDALKNKAEIYLELNNPLEALYFANTGLEYHPESPDLNEIKGLILYELGKEDEALDAFMKALENSKGVLGNKGKEKMKLILNKYKLRIDVSQIEQIKKDLENCIKLFSDLKDRDPIQLDIPSFTLVNVPFNWKDLHIEPTNILNYQNVHDGLICKICFSLVKFPKCCQVCDELFCSACIESSLEKIDSCPHCRTSPYKDSRVNKIVKEIYNNIQLKCPLECEVQLPMENMEKHINECNKRNYYYECSLCLRNLKNKDEAKAHKKECCKINFNCSLCLNNFKNGELQEHMESCALRLIRCEKCSCNIPFVYNNTHESHCSNSFSAFKGIVIEILKRII